MFVSLVSLILVGITQVLGATLAGSGKSQAMQQVKQNGQFAISTISRLLLQSNEVTVCAGSQLDFTILENGSTSTYRFETILFSETNLFRIRKTYNGVQSWLTDERVNVTNFECNLIPPGNGQPGIINFSFNIGKPGLSVENIIANINFRDSVSLRNY